MRCFPDGGQLGERRRMVRAEVFVREEREWEEEEMVQFQV
jgi:hypothetical protein